MYVHRACKLSEQELDEGKKAGGFCANCGQSGTIFHVVGTIDYYQHVLNGVLYNVSEGIESTPMEAVWEREKVTAAKVKAARKGENWTAPEVLTAPRKKGMSEEPPEPELAEEIEAIQEVAETALEEILEEVTEEDNAPEETPLEAEPELTREELEARLAELEAEAKKAKK